MRWVGLGLLVTGIAAAQPATETPFEACRARRRALTAEAMKIDDAARRGEALHAMPVCSREADGSTQVIEAEAPEVVDNGPYSPLVAAVRTGANATEVFDSRVGLEPRGGGPFVDVELGYRWTHAYSIGAFASYAHFSDSSNSLLGMLADSESLYSFGARGAFHRNRWTLSGGLGVLIEHDDHSVDAFRATISTTYLSLQELAAYDLVSARGMTAQVEVIVNEAGVSDRDIFAIQVGLGLRL
jgi:hypothetical protein